MLLIFFFCMFFHGNLECLGTLASTTWDFKHGFVAQWQMLVLIGEPYDLFKKTKTFRNVRGNWLIFPKI